MADERIVRWDAVSQSFPREHHQYRFIVLNERRGFDMLRQRFLAMAKPTDDDTILVSGNVPDTKLEYFVWAVTSFELQPSEFEKIRKCAYDGNIRRNRNICARKDDTSLADYIEEAIARGELPFVR